MNHFPISKSTLSAEHLGLFLKEKYQLTDNEPFICKLIKAGINDTYVLGTRSKKFVFRVYSLNWRSKTDILEEIKLLDELKKQQIPISYPIIDAEDNYIQILNAPEGERFGVLFSYAEGEKLLNYSEEIHFKIGVLIAKFHQITHNLSLERVHYTPQILLIDSLEQLKKFLPAETEEMAFMLSTQKYLLEQWEKVNSKEVRQGIVHLDIWFDNLNISRAGEITIFDFDFCGNGWLCLDVAYYILQVYSTERVENECKAKVESFLNGYESINHLNEVEKQLLPMLGVSIYFFYIGIQCQRFDWSNVFLNEMYLKRFINLLIKRYFDIHQLGN